MSDLFDHRAVPLHRQIAAAEREVRQRERVYPRLVERGRMRPETARDEIEAMKAIAATLKTIQTGKD